ncbi:DNA repair protein rad9 [Erysiphe neolycopersici]|uniref:DNA repair protein rad9 n=1 Tax=Erysiphe neolycopersici TaxID=212602 RepID=A0A420HUS6_9PEZI|nr:DNA repair protein rad9 [Erysiphe neolycopersici]
MIILKFSLNPDALSKFYDILICLGKYSEYVSIEASEQKLVLTTLNSTKSAYASFTLSANKFFSKYDFKPLRTKNGLKDKFDLKIYNRALLSVFKGRFSDQSKEKETAVEKCDAYIDDDEDGNSQSRFVIEITCRHGVRKVYKLTFESQTSMHAFFDKESASNSWSISSKVLREFTDHFGPGTEQLDIYLEGGRVNFTSFTEKILLGNEILKKPLHTTIAMDILEFTEFAVEELLHTVINVKDFKAIVAHCGILNVMVKVSYSQPSSPMQVTYDLDGIMSNFILMTVGGLSFMSTLNQKQKEPKRPVSRQSRGTRQPLHKKSSPKRSISKEPPDKAFVSERSTQPRIVKPSPPPPKPSIQSESLFLPREDQDQKWEPLNFDEEDEEMLLWDAGEKDRTTFDSGRRFSMSLTNDEIVKNDSNEMISEGVPPTQKLSQVRKLGIFD